MCVFFFGLLFSEEFMQRKITSKQCESIHFSVLNNRQMTNDPHSIVLKEYRKSESNNIVLIKSNETEVNKENYY